MPRFHWTYDELQACWRHQQLTDDASSNWSSIDGWWDPSAAGWWYLWEEISDEAGSLEEENSDEAGSAQGGTAATAPPAAQSEEDASEVGTAAPGHSASWRRRRRRRAGSAPPAAQTNPSPQPAPVCIYIPPPPPLVCGRVCVSCAREVPRCSYELHVPQAPKVPPPSALPPRPMPSFSPTRYRHSFPKKAPPPLSRETATASAFRPVVLESCHLRFLWHQSRRKPRHRFLP